MARYFHVSRKKETRGLSGSPGQGDLLEARARLAGGSCRLLPAALLGRRRGLALVALVALLGLGLLLGLGVRLGLFLGRLGTIHQLEHDHGGAVAGPGAGPEDPRVAAVALTEARHDGVEKLPHHFRVGNHGEHLPAGVQVVALGERDHLIREPADGLGLGLGRHDPLVTEEGHEKVPEERPAVRGDPPQLEPGLAVPHFTPPRPRVPRRLGSMRMPRERPMVPSTALISSMDLSPRFLTCSRSSSVFWTRSATTCISALLRALMARAGRGRSSRDLPRLSWRNPSPVASASSSSSSPPSGARRVNWSRMCEAARVRASSGDTAPFVHTSRVSFS